MNPLIMIKQTPRQTTHKYSYRRINTYQDVRSYSNINITHNINMVGVAKLCNLKQKFQTLFSSVFITPASAKVHVVHPLFKYLMKRMLFYDSMNKINKMTDYKNIVLNQITYDVKSNRNQVLKEQIIKLFDQVFQKNKVIYNWDGIKRKEKLKQYQQIIHQEEAQVYKELTSWLNAAPNSEFPQTILNQLSQFQLQLWKSPEFIRQMINTVNKIEPLRQNQQFIKYNLFQAKCKKYYNAGIMTQRKSKARTHYLKMNRLSTSPQPVLQTVYDMVDNRKGVNLRPEYVQFIKDLIRELNNFEVTSSTNQNTYIYDNITPEYIVFDQLSLQPKLSFDPFIMEMAGVTKKPFSVQTKLCFNTAVVDFDYFQSLNELDDTVQRILKDPYYGCLQMYDSQKIKLTPQIKEQIKKQSEQLSQIKQQIQFWRFILTSYYILQGKMLGSNNNCVNIRDCKQHFKEQLKAVKAQLQGNISKLQKYIGIQIKKVENRQFKLCMKSIYELVQCESNDSVLIKNKFIKVKKYLDIKVALVKQIIKILISENVFNRMSNIKKYIWMFLITSSAIFQNASKIIKYELIKPGQRKQLRVYLQMSPHKQRGQRSHSLYNEMIFKRLLDYKSRDQNRDQQSKFINQDIIGKLLMHLMTKIHDDIKNIEKYSAEMDELEDLDCKTEQNRIKYQHLINKSMEIIVNNEQNIKSILQQSSYIELILKGKQGLHKITPQQQPIKQFFNLMTKKLQLLIETLLSITEKNYIVFEALIVPKFKLTDDNDKKIQIPKNAKNISSEMGYLDAIGELLQPHRMKMSSYLRSYKQIQNQSQRGSQSVIVQKDREGQGRQVEIGSSQKQKLQILGNYN